MIAAGATDAEAARAVGVDRATVGRWRRREAFAGAVSAGRNTPRPKRRSFVAEAAARTGRSERSIRRDIAIAKGIAQDVKDIIRDTPIANRGTDLERLSRMPIERQRAAAHAVRESGAPTLAKAMAARPDIVAPETPSEPGGADVEHPTLFVQFKRRSRIAIRRWFDTTAAGAARAGKTPVLVIREDFGEPLAVVRLADLVALQDAAVGGWGDDQARTTRG